MPPKRPIAKKPAAKKRAVRRVSASARRTSGQKLKGLFTGKDLTEMNRPLLSTKSEVELYTMLANKMRPVKNNKNDQSFVLEFSKAKRAGITKLVQKVHSRLSALLKKLVEKKDLFKNSSKKNFMDYIKDMDKDNVSDAIQMAMATFTYSELNLMKKDMSGFLNKSEKKSKIDKIKEIFDANGDTSMSKGIYQFFTSPNNTSTPSSIRPNTSAEKKEDDSEIVAIRA